VTADSSFRFSPLTGHSNVRVALWLFRRLGLALDLESDRMASGNACSAALNKCHDLRVGPVPVNSTSWRHRAAAAAAPGLAAGSNVLP
jgi:hypothetical protein